MILLFVHVYLHSLYLGVRFWFVIPSCMMAQSSGVMLGQDALADVSYFICKYIYIYVCVYMYLFINK